MRSLADERGAVAVLVAGSMVMMMGFAALAIDVSSLYQERRTLQNGADAGALAAAKDCATPTGCVSSKVKAFADANADDGKANVDEVCGTGAGLAACAAPPSVPAGSKYVRVTTSTNEAASPGNPTQVNFAFAPVLDLVDPGHSAQHRGETIRASAVAAWGSPGGATTLPLTFSLCEYLKAVPTPAALQTGPPFTGAAQVVYFHGSGQAGTCPHGPSGADLPGGFGWLAAPNCQVAVTADGWVDDRGGNDSSPCMVNALVNTTVLLPVYDQILNSRYHLFGFAAMYLTGYKFNGGVKFPSSMSCPGTPGNSGTCLQGYFTGFTTTGTVLGGPDMGVKIIKLVG